MLSCNVQNGPTKPILLIHVYLCYYELFFDLNKHLNHLYQCLFFHFVFLLLPFFSVRCICLWLLLFLPLALRLDESCLAEGLVEQCGIAFKGKWQVGMCVEPI